MENAILGAFIMLLYGSLCYAINKVKKGEAFTPEKFGKTVVIGFILGAASQALGIPTDQLGQMSLVAFLGVIIDKLAGLLTHKKAPS